MRGTARLILFLAFLLWIQPAPACSTHGTNAGNHVKIDYGPPDDLGQVKISLAIESTLAEPVAPTTCVAGIGLGSDALPLGPGISVNSARLEVFNRATGATGVLNQFDFSPDTDTSEGFSRGSSGTGAPGPVIDGATWFGFSTDVSPFELTLAANETVQIVFELEMPLNVLPFASEVQFAAGEGQPDGMPVFSGEHPVSYFTGVATGVVLSLFGINAGLNDAWVNAGAPFQGMFITVFPDLGIIFLAWFTFDSLPPVPGAAAVLGAPDQRWVTGIGSYRGNRVTLAAELTSGGLFNSPSPLPAQEGGYGFISLDFSDCATLKVSFIFPSAGLEGSFDARRVLDDNLALCQALGAD